MAKSTETVGILAARQAAARAEHAALPWREIDGFMLSVEPGGGHGYPMLLTCAEFSVYLTAHGMRPTFWVQLRADFIRTEDPRAAFDQAVAVIAQLSKGPLQGINVSRVDPFADVGGWSLSKADAEGIVTSVSEVACYFVPRSNQRRPAMLQDVNKAMVDAFLKWRRSVPTLKYPGGSPFAVRAAAVTLKRFASYLAIDGILADVGGISVLRHVKRGKVDDDVRRPLSDADMALAINAASRLGGVPRAVCVLGFSSGLRLNELREARVGDLDLERGEFHVRPETSKFGKGRTVFLHPATASDLDRFLRDRSTNREPEAPLFPTRTGEAFTEDGFAKLFQRIHRAAGLRTFSAHLMRHTWATNFMRVPGASLLELKRQGGWQRWEQVERYSHAVPHHDRKTLPNPLQKTAFVQLPSTRVSRLSSIG